MSFLPKGIYRFNVIQWNLSRFFFFLEFDKVIPKCYRRIKVQGYLATSKENGKGLSLLDARIYQKAVVAIIRGSCLQIARLTEGRDKEPQTDLRICGTLACDPTTSVGAELASQWCLLHYT